MACRRYPRGQILLDLTALMVVEDTMHQRLYGLHLFGIVELDARSTRVRKVLDRVPPLGHLRGINATWDTMGRLWTARLRACTCSTRVRPVGEGTAA